MSWLKICAAMSKFSYNVIVVAKIISCENKPLFMHEEVAPECLLNQQYVW